MAKKTKATISDNLTDNIDDSSANVEIQEEPKSKKKAATTTATKTKAKESAKAVTKETDKLTAKKPTKADKKEPDKATTKKAAKATKSAVVEEDVVANIIDAPPPPPKTRKKKAVVESIVEEPAVVEPVAVEPEKPKKRVAPKKSEIQSLFAEVIAFADDADTKNKRKKSTKKAITEPLPSPEPEPIKDKPKKTKKSAPIVETMDALEIPAPEPVIASAPKLKASKKGKIEEKSEPAPIVEEYVIEKAEEEFEEEVDTEESEDVANAVQSEQNLPLSKSAKRRARKKAKKQKEIELAKLQAPKEVKKEVEKPKAVPQPPAKDNKQQNQPERKETKNNTPEKQYQKPIALDNLSIDIDDILMAENETTVETVPANKYSPKQKEPFQKKLLVPDQHKNDTQKKDLPKSVSADMPYEYKEQSNKNAEIRNIPFSKSIKPIPFVDLNKWKDDRKQKDVKEVTEIVPINPERLLTPAQRNDPFFQNFYRKIEKFVVTEMLVEKGSKVVVGVSGGVDSVVMLDIMANLSDKYHFALFVAHYNHNLRAEASDNDAAFVKELAASYNIPFYWASGKVAQYAEKNDMSIEEAARFLRYFFFERTTRTIKADFLATAHNLEDSAETFLLNLLRGTGLTGLSGIPAKRQFIKDVILIRPLLTIHKQQIHEYAEKRGLEWHEDETNVQLKYTRNKIRLDLLPKLSQDFSPSVVDIINRSAKLIQGADRIIHDYVRTHLPTILFDVSNDSISIKVPLFKTFDEFIRGEMLQTILMKYFRMMPPSMKMIDRILKLDSSDTGAVCEINKTIMAVRDRNSIVITKKQVPTITNEKISKTGKFQIANLTFVLKQVALEEVEYNANPKVEFVDYDLVSEVLTVRNWEHEDIINPLGMDGSMKISDFLMNEKIPVLDKPNVLVLTTSSNEIIWVCKYRISDKYKVTDTTQHILRIELKEKLK
ncbi:MAG: tRNA lysidine(34) synthetase TilS [Ignavibacteria bacterium]|jgi:tRNA(Ile)-lysidine synthase|nr:tRNA lysidine(34) synthetase TilS [Ignavibacteria bacterium]